MSRKSDEEVLARINLDVKHIIRFGEAFPKSTLKMSFVWQEIQSLCWVLGLDNVIYWNKICSVHPHLGDITNG